MLYQQKCYLILLIKSIPYDFIKENGYKLDYNYLKGIDYIKAVDLMIKENV